MHAMIEIVLLIAIAIVEMTQLNRAILESSIALPSAMRGIAASMITTWLWKASKSSNSSSSSQSMLA
eukprot:952019-Rhodomonas_salina.2